MKAYNLSDILAGLAENADDGDGRKRPRPSETLTINPEAAIARLQEAAARYFIADAGPPFAVGDLITPVSDSPIKGAGTPHIVIAVRHADYNFALSGDMTPASNCYGAKADTRILSFSGDDVITPFWVESGHFVRWEPKVK